MVEGYCESLSDAVDRVCWRKGLFVARGVCSNLPVQGGRSLATRMGDDVCGAVLVASRCPQLAGTFTKRLLGRLACECRLLLIASSCVVYGAGCGTSLPDASILASL